jgi:cell division protein FtsW
MFVTIALLIIPAFPKIFGSLAYGFGGAYRWIKLGPLTFQPSEIIKLVFIIYLAAWLDKRQYEIRSFSAGFIPFVIILGTVFFLIMKQPDLGTASVVVLIAASMFFVAGANLFQIFGGVIVASFFFWELIKRSPYRLSRLMVFFNPSDTLGKAYHINQALLAIGSGGLWGRGFGQSIQKHLYLPQPATDSIFAVICEELGFIRALFIPLIFIIFAWLGFTVASKAPDFFGKMLAIGIVSWIIFQAVINIGTMLAIFPLTGIPLPFISYGGSSLVISLAAMGILLNISKQTN